MEQIILKMDRNKVNKSASISSIKDEYVQLNKNTIPNDSYLFQNIDSLKTIKKSSSIFKTLMPKNKS